MANGWGRKVGLLAGILTVVVMVLAVLAIPWRFGTTQIEHGSTLRQYGTRLTSGEAKDNELDGKYLDLAVSVATIEAQVGKIDTLQDIMEDVRDRLPEE